MSSPEPRAAYRIRDVVIDVAAYELRRDDRPVHLERQPMDLLILLVERRGQLVSRGEIIDALWGQDVFVDVETGVHTAIRKIRQALRDPVTAPLFIETVPGKGYRFIAAVDVLPGPSTPSAVVRPATAVGEPPHDSDASAAAVASPGSASPGSTSPGVMSPAAAAPPDGWVRRVAIVAAVVLGVSALAGVVGWSWRHPTVPDASVRIVIAVLPFENISRDPDTEYLAAGLHEDTIVSLGRIDPDRVSVIGRTTMLAYRGTSKSLADIGHALGLDYIVESTLRAESESVRVTSRLVRATDQVQIWSESFDKPRGSVLDLQQEMSQRIAEHVGARLSPTRRSLSSQHQTASAEAHDQLLRGRAFLYQRNPAAMRRALEAFQRATALDPEFALAWAGLAIAHTGRVINSDTHPSEARPIALEAATRAVQVDPGLSEAHTALGQVNWLLEWNWSVAEGEFRRAVALDPNSSATQQSLGHMLSQAGRPAEADPAMRRARELDALNPFTFAMSSQVAFQSRNAKSALALASRAIELNEGMWIGHQMRGQALEQLGQYDAALEALAAAIRLSGHNSKPVSLQGYVLARAARAAEARAVLASLEATSRERYVPPYAMALVSAGLGEAGATFDWLERAYAVRDVHLIYLTVDPKWDQFRGDRRFVTLLARCGFTTP
jgi:TolB-like protein/DNA-binding winged helix-turn-helix (wHTH) protein/tetratricopeptide (TPR) repeat protein